MIKILIFFQVLDKSQIIVSTALASRGTDIRVSNQMNELGGHPGLEQRGHDHVPDGTALAQKDGPLVEPR